MRPTHVEHIGIAVKNLDEAVEYYERVWGLHCHAIEEIHEQKVRTAIFRLGETKIELLESTAEDGPIAKFIAKRGEGVHHIAFAVADLVGALEELTEKGVALVDQRPRRGAEGLSVAFLHPKGTGGVLVELCSKP